MKQDSSGKNSNKQRPALGAMLIALAMIFSYVEMLLSINFGIPGIKPGLANLVIIIALYRLGDGWAFSINLIRIVLSGIMFSGLFSILYALSGGICSLIAMITLKRCSSFSIIGVSFTGGVIHNLAQLTVAYFLIGHIGIFAYFPVLLFSGFIAGTLLGITADIILRRLPEISFD